MVDTAATAGEGMDGAKLKAKLRRAERRKKFEAVGLIIPLLILMIGFYFIPISLMLYRSIDNQQMREVLPNTAQVIERWDGRDIPDEQTFAALAQDLKEARAKHIIAKAARRLNFDKAGFASLVSRTGRKLSGRDIGGQARNEFMRKAARCRDRTQRRELFSAAVAHRAPRDGLCSTCHMI